MLYRKLGNTGKKVSILGFGCMRLPIIFDGNPKNINEPLATEMLHYAEKQRKHWGRNKCKLRRK